MNYLETIRIEQGVPIAIDYHRKRMYQTTGCILPKLVPPTNLRQGIVKCRIVYNREILAIDFTPYTMPSIQTLRIVKDNSIEYSKKYEDRSSISVLFEQREGCDDVLIVKNGFISDTSFCNIVFEKSGILYTPISPLLAGTRRERLLEQGTIITAEIRPENIHRYDRALLINALIDLNDNLSIDISHIFC